MAAKTFSTYLSELAEATSLGAGDRVPVLESSATKYVDGGDIGGGSYLKYVALLSQSGTDAPVATVLENTLGGTVVWSYEEQGVYIATLEGVFLAGKTFCLTNANYIADDVFVGNMGRETDDTVQLLATDITGSVIDHWNAMSVEIRVYP